MRVDTEVNPRLESSVGLMGVSAVLRSATAPVDALFEERLLQTIESYDSNAESYTERFQYVDLLEHRHRFLEQLADATGVILDAGCGPGRDLLRFAADGFRAIGLDRSAELLHIARREGHEVVEGDLRDMPFKSESFTGIWACASLLHLSIAELATAMAEFKRVLRPDGSLFLSVRHGSGMEERLDPTGHTRWFYFYLAPEVEQVLLESGFVDIDAKVEAGAAHGTWVNLHARKPSTNNSRLVSYRPKCEPNHKPKRNVP